jgi:hypothetical protein
MRAAWISGLQTPLQVTLPFYYESGCWLETARKPSLVRVFSESPRKTSARGEAGGEWREAERAGPASVSLLLPLLPATARTCFRFELLSL